MGVRFVQTSRLPAPYGECTETQGSQPYYYNGTYLMEGCFRSCIQDKIVASCGCYDPAYAPPDDDSVVSCASYSIPQVNQKSLQFKSSRVYTFKITPVTQYVKHVTSFFILYSNHILKVMDTKVARATDDLIRVHFTSS